MKYYTIIILPLLFLLNGCNITPNKPTNKKRFVYYVQESEPSNLYYNKKLLFEDSIMFILGQVFQLKEEPPGTYAAVRILRHWNIKEEHIIIDLNSNRLKGENLLLTIDNDTTLLTARNAQFANFDSLTLTYSVSEPSRSDTLSDNGIKKIIVDDNTFRLYFKYKGQNQFILIKEFNLLPLQKRLLNYLVSIAYASKNDLTVHSKQTHGSDSLSIVYSDKTITMSDLPLRGYFEEKLLLGYIYNLEYAFMNVDHNPLSLHHFLIEEYI
ncbi:MAG TPA: hypothetical protein VEC12_07020 [Bacteroidia bacterium]|nr:hypothetical protein [Bacteroidia bacterium]